jgi:signal recognition particle subunit SRP54
MTPHERRVPHVIDMSRRKRIAAGSGSTVEQVSQLLESRKQMAKLMKMAGSGKMPSLPGMAAGAPTMGGGPRPSATRKASSKRKKKKAKR